MCWLGRCVMVEATPGSEWRGEEQKQVPIRLRSGQAFDSAEVRFAQDDRVFAEGVWNG